jgi:hypothetical protein
VVITLAIVLVLVELRASWARAQRLRDKDKQIADLTADLNKLYAILGQLDMDTSETLDDEDLDVITSQVRDDFMSGIRDRQKEHNPKKES